MQAYPSPVHANDLNARCKDARLQGFCLSKGNNG